jgi:hypothetical protein
MNLEQKKALEITEVFAGDKEISIKCVQQIIKAGRSFSAGFQHEQSGESFWVDVIKEIRKS